MYWQRKSYKEIKSIVFNALDENNSFHNHNIMGLPATYLDPKNFPPDIGFLDEAPYVKSFIENPNHIGLHTYHSSLPAFKGTQKIELDLLRICAEEILKIEKDCYDGYIAPGGTECNIQALWIYREYYKDINGADDKEIFVLFSEDTHYSAHKACNLLQLNYKQLTVNFDNRNIKLDPLEKTLIEIQGKKIVKFIILIINLGTTMFGSVDNINKITKLLIKYNLKFKIHVDAAFGGFIYPFTNSKNKINFTDQNIDSISLDGHKMLKAPYGTGIFIIRKGLIDHVLTSQANYIEGQDHTICGSRSGANAIATWMILNIYGSEKLKEHMLNLIKKTDYICNSLNELGISYFRNDNMNIITIRANDISEKICKKFTLVPNTHTDKPNWWKIVVMDHVNWELIEKFINELVKSNNHNLIIEAS